MFITRLLPRCVVRQNQYRLSARINNLLEFLMGFLPRPVMRRSGTSFWIAVNARNVAFASSAAERVPKTRASGIYELSHAKQAGTKITMSYFYSRRERAPTFRDGAVRRRAFSRDTEHYSFRRFIALKMQSGRESAFTMACNNAQFHGNDKRRLRDNRFNEIGSV